MLNTTQCWSVSLILIGLIWLYLLVRKGPAASLGAVMVLSFAFPVWVKMNPFGVRSVSRRLLPVSQCLVMSVIEMAGFSKRTLAGLSEMLCPINPFHRYLP